MPDVDLPLWLNVIIVAGIVAGSLVAVAGFMVKTGRGIRWVKDAVHDAFVEVAREQADKVAEADRLVAEQLREKVEAENAQMASWISEIRAEMKPNGGTSARDVLDRVERKLDTHIQHSSLDRRDLRRWLETIDPGRHADPEVDP